MYVMLHIVVTANKTLYIYIMYIALGPSFAFVSDHSN